MPTLNSIAQAWMLPGLVFLLLLLLLIFLRVFFMKLPHWFLMRFGASDKLQVLKFLGLSMGGILFVIQIAISSGVNQNAEQGLRQERLKNAIEHLGNRSGSVRLVGAYELFHLAEDNQELRQTALDILCAHIRRTTGEEAYRREHKSEPSEEIQSLLTLLFVRKYGVFKSLHIDLQNSWLKGADLEGAHLENAVLNNAHLQGAILDRAQLQGARLGEAHLQGAYLKRARLEEAHLQGANLLGAQLQGARLLRAQLQGARLGETQLQGANLLGAQLQGAYLRKAQLQGARLGGTQLQGAFLAGAQLQGAFLASAQLQGAFLKEAQLQGAYLLGVTLQGAALQGAHLQGVVSSSQSFPLESFAERMRRGINRESDFARVAFEGGLSPDDIDEIVSGLPGFGLEKTRLRSLLKQHASPTASNKLPKNSGAIVGKYKKEEAEAMDCRIRRSHV